MSIDHGYEFSGLPTYGIDRETGMAYRRSYVLYSGRRPRSVRGEWVPLGLLAPQTPLDHIEQDCLEEGYLEEFFDSRGCPHTRVSQPPEHGAEPR